MELSVSAPQYGHFVSLLLITLLQYTHVSLAIVSHLAVLIVLTFDVSTEAFQTNVKKVSFTQYAHSPSACKDEDYHVEKGGKIWYVESGDHGTRLTI